MEWVRRKGVQYQYWQQYWEIYRTPKKMRISVFDYLKSTIMVQKLHVGVVLEWFWPADFRNTIIGVIFNGKQISILGFAKAFVPFSKKDFKKVQIPLQNTKYIFVNHSKCSQLWYFWNQQVKTIPKLPLHVVFGPLLWILDSQIH